MSTFAARPRRPVQSLKAAGSLTSRRAVGAECRVDAGLERRRPQLCVPLEIVDRIVGGAERPHLEAREDALRVQPFRGQLLVGRRPDPIGVPAVEQLADAEVALELEMGPVIQRVAQRLRHRRRPGAELVQRPRVAGAVAFVDAVGAHRPPLVMIALEPDLEQVVEPPVLGDVARRQVVVIVENRLLGSVALVKAPRRRGLEKEICAEERHGFTFLTCFVRCAWCLVLEVRGCQGAKCEVPGCEGARVRGAQCAGAR